MKNFKCVHSPIKECLQTCLTDWKPGFHVRQNLKYCSNLWLSMLLTSLVYTLAIFGVQCTRYCGHWAVLSCIKTRFCGFQLFLKWVCYFKWLVNLNLVLCLHLYRIIVSFILTVITVSYETNHLDLGLWSLIRVSHQFIPILNISSGGGYDMNVGIIVWLLSWGYLPMPLISLFRLAPPFKRRHVLLFL